MIINEMAGSGGDLMPYMFKRRKIGPLVGKRTWGGLVHTADTPPFIDGGSMIAPRGGFLHARRQVGGGERRRRAGHRRRELAEGRDRRPRSATRARGAGSDADAEGGVFSNSSLTTDVLDAALARLIPRPYDVARVTAPATQRR
jgi:hypothetical protein